MDDTVASVILESEPCYKKNYGYLPPSRSTQENEKRQIFEFD
jgi:hypothetical protein